MFEQEQENIILKLPYKLFVWFLLRVRNSDEIQIPTFVAIFQFNCPEHFQSKLAGKTKFI